MSPKTILILYSNIIHYRWVTKRLPQNIDYLSTTWLGSSPENLPYTSNLHLCLRTIYSISLNYSWFIIDIKKFPFHITYIFVKCLKGNLQRLVQMCACIWKIWYKLFKCIEKRLTCFDVLCLVIVFHYCTDIYRCKSMNASDKSRLTHYEWEGERRNSRDYIWKRGNATFLNWEREYNWFECWTHFPRCLFLLNITSPARFTAGGCLVALPNHWFP